MAERTLIILTPDPLDPVEAIRFVSDPASGATCLFEGTVRSSSTAADDEVSGLRYEAYEELATSRMNEIAGEMMEKWPVRKAALLHRIGELGVGEVSVLVACSTPHRADAFEACRHGIERIKNEVPIWKQEQLVTGEAHWVRGS
jgi:molybdopterin synthase catalytic subunit